MSWMMDNDRSSSMRRGSDRRETKAIETAAQLAALGPVWDELARRPGAMVTQDRDWSDAFLATYGPRGGLHVVSVTTAHGVALAPLQRSRGVLGRLELPGVNELYEPMDVLYHEASALPDLARAVLELGRPVFLRRLPSDSAVVAAFERAAEGRAVVVRRPVASAPWIALDASWQQPERKLSARYRSDLRRGWRRAEQLGTVQAEVLSPTPAELAPLLDELYEVEAAGWKGDGGSALAKDPARGAFYRRYARRAAERGILRMAFLRIDGRAAAAQLAVEWDRGLWLLKIGYRDEFARCSPGSLLMQASLRYAAVRGLEHYEFLGTAEAWTRTWTEAERACVSLRLYPYGLAGMAALAVDFGERAAHDMGERLRVKS